MKIGIRLNFIHGSLFFVKCMYLCFICLMDVFSTREDSRAREDVLYSYLNKNRWRMMTDRLEFFIDSVGEEEHDRDAVFVAY